MRRVDELDRAEREVGALEQPVQLVPDLQVTEGSLGRLHDRRGSREALLRRALRPLPLALAQMRGDLALQPGADRRAEEEGRSEQDAQADEQRDDGRTEGEEGLQLRASSGPAAAACRARRPGAGAGRDELDALARAGGGHVGDAPGAPELLSERRVDRVQRGGAAGALIAAAGFLRQALERRRAGSSGSRSQSDRR